MGQWARERERLPAYLWAGFLAVALLVLSRSVVPASPRQHAQTLPSLAPILSPPGGCYDRDVRLVIQAPSPEASVIFTTDGSVPSHAVGSAYAQPLLLSATAPAVTVVRARAVLPSGSLGPVVSASYFVGVPAALPMMSLIVDPVDLWDTERGIYANPLERGDAWERPVDVTYVETDRRLGFHVQAGLRIHGGGSRQFDKKAFRLFFRREYGTPRLEYPLFADSVVASFEQLVLHNGGQDWAVPFSRESGGNWTLVRNSLLDALARQTGGYASHDQPVLLFLNGEPWGIYQVRERLDAQFLADYYGFESTDIIKAPELVPGEVVRAGDSEHWERLLQFVETHDLADPDNYAYVESQVDVANLIDYNILQIYAANADWPHHNVEQFRPREQGGRWHWLFWDCDCGFGAQTVPPDSQVETDVMRFVLEVDHPRTGGRDVLLLRRLLETPVFRERFLSRAADLLNTTLSPESVVAQIDVLAAQLEPDILYEVTRWSGASDWASSVEELRDFARRRPDYLRRQMAAAFGLEGTAQLTFEGPFDGSGTVAVNGRLVQDLPWRGVYFQGTHVQVVAVPAPGYRFAGWDPPDLPASPAITLSAAGARTLVPRFAPATDDAIRPGDVVLARYHVSQEGGPADGWFELLVTRPGGVDLRGWRVTDNDAKAGADEGSLVFADRPAFARVPRGTVIRVVLPRAGAQACPEDDVGLWDRRMVLCLGNGNLDDDADPGFNLGRDDNLALLAPGPTAAFEDDQGVAFVAWGTGVTAATFGVLSDGVLPADAAVEFQSGSPPRQELLVGLIGLAGLVVLGLGVRSALRRARRGAG
jgi:hypothetical protein